ncbi:MAG: class I SAM-dependent methyltransferase [Proteobacteria bacterium]|nr:class I SAM-dependent methyltransferase [Pseudomonadota bacterium]MBU1639525.1 class I SAM-dependent methyltransferase [Pseudomonadota bacterium]
MAPYDTPPISCLLCGADYPHLFYHENGYPYYRCHACGLLSLWPQPTATDLHDHYQEYLPLSPKEVADWGFEMAPVIESSADFLGRHFPEPGRLLDIGCGYGFFLEAMSERNWQVEGIELSKPAAEIARAKGRGTIHSCAVEEVKDLGLFDVITMFYVIEHVADPLQTLKSIRALLKPGGVLVLRYPNTSPLLKFSGSLARSLGLMQAPSHLFDFSGDSMEILLKKAGYGSCLTTIDANTRSPHLVRRFISCYIGLIPVLLARLSKGHLLLPGYSRVSYASLDGAKFKRNLS